jgi:hypothetical protein
MTVSPSLGPFEFEIGPIQTKAIFRPAVIQHLRISFRALAHMDSRN